MARRSRGQGTIYKEVDSARRTRWRAEKIVRLPDGTRRRVIVRGRTEGEALAQLQLRERELANSHPDAERMTLDVFLRRWLEYKRPRVKPATIAEYQRVVDIATREIGHIPLARVQPLHVQRVVSSEEAAGRATTANNVRRYLKSAFRQAERWELITRNPVRNLEPVRREPPKRSVWSPVQIRAFLEGAEAHADPVMRALFMTAVFAGLRQGELLALPWANVTPSSIRVDRTASRYAEGGVNTPKTRESRRVVPIHASLYAVIRDARDGSSSPLAFPSRVGTMLGQRNVDRAFKRVIGYAGVPMMRFHDLRRTAATLWALQGASPKTIQKLLGHSTPHLALAIYTDVVEGQLEAAVLDPGAYTGGENGGN